MQPGQLRPERFVLREGYKKSALDPARFFFVVAVAARHAAIILSFAANARVANA